MAQRAIINMINVLLTVMKTLSNHTLLRWKALFLCVSMETVPGAHFITCSWTGMFKLFLFTNSYDQTSAPPSCINVAKILTGKVTLLAYNQYECFLIEDPKTKI